MPAGEVCISTASNVLGMLLGANTSTTTVSLSSTRRPLARGANISETYPPPRWLDKARDAGVYRERGSPQDAHQRVGRRPAHAPARHGRRAGPRRDPLRPRKTEPSTARGWTRITGFELMVRAQPWSVDKGSASPPLSKTPSLLLPDACRAPAPSSGWAAASPAIPTGCRASGDHRASDPARQPHRLQAGAPHDGGRQARRRKKEFVDAVCGPAMIPASTSAACSTP